MKVIKESNTLWGNGFLATVKRLTNDKNGNARYRFVIYIKKDNIILTETRKTCINLSNMKNALPTINLMLEEYKLNGKV